jgi:hypothetical protein
VKAKDIEIGQEYAWVSREYGSTRVKVIAEVGATYHDKPHWTLRHLQELRAPRNESETKKAKRTVLVQILQSNTGEPVESNFDRLNGRKCIPLNQISTTWEEHVVLQEQERRATIDANAREAKRRKDNEKRYNKAVVEAIGLGVSLPNVLAIRDVSSTHPTVTIPLNALCSLVKMASGERSTGKD